MTLAAAASATLATPTASAASAPSAAQQRLSAFALACPDAARLACYASLASRVDAALLRRLRLRLMPGSDPSAEADLWFGDLPQSRDGQSLVLDPGVAALLRQQLAQARLPDGQPALALVYQHTRELHLAWPASLQLEEALVHLALADGDNAGSAEIERLLRPALAAMATDPQRAVEMSRWVLRALPALPGAVRDSPAAAALVVAATTHLGVGQDLLVSLQGRAMPTDLPWLLAAATLPRQRLQLAVMGQALVFSAAAEGVPASACLDVPRTQPVLLELAGTGGTSPWQRVVPVTLGVPVPLAEPWQQLALRCLTGETYQVQRLPPPPPAAAYRFEKDIFISASHIDNQPLVTDSRGWVETLHGVLAQQLQTRLGRSLSIWRDSALQAGDGWLEATNAALHQSAVLVCILSPAYLQSKWCQRELQAFCSDPRVPLRVGKHSRVIKVLSQPIDHNTLPAPLRDTLGYELFALVDHRAVTLNPAQDKRHAERYFQTVARMAMDIAAVLEALEHPDSAPASDRPPIYLAECAEDLQAQHATLREALQAHGWQVLPDQPLPREVDACRRAVAQALARSALSIHLVGTQAGPMADGAIDLTLGVLQNEMAAAQSRRSGLPRLIWLPATADSARQTTQRDFIQALQRDGDAQSGADLIVGSFEDFRALATDRLAQMPDAAREPHPSAGDGPPITRS